MRPMLRVLPAAILAACLASAALAQVKFENRFPEGSSTTTTTFSVDQKLTLAGMEIPTTAEVVTTTQHTLKPEAGGTRRLEEKTRGIKFRLGVLGQNAEFDSATNMVKADNEQLATALEGLKVLSKATLTYVIGADGKVQAVEGIDAVKGMLPAGAAGFESQLNPEHLKREMNQQLNRLPENPVKPGDRWQRTEVMDVGGGQTFTFVTHYEYEGEVERDGRKLDRMKLFREAVTYSQDPNAPSPLKHVSSDLKVESSMGSLLVDRATGTVVDSSDLVRVTGAMTFEVNGMQLPGKLDLTLTNRAVTQR